MGKFNLEGSKKLLMIAHTLQPGPIRKGLLCWLIRTAQLVTVDRDDEFPRNGHGVEKQPDTHAGRSLASSTL